MKVSIVTVYYNREGYVTESLKSLCTQTYEDVEIIAIDDGSSDGTLKAMQALEHHRLHVISQTNQGFVKSMIRAVEMAKGELIAVHGSGDWSHPERIAKQVQAFDDDKIGVVGTYVENVNTLTGEIGKHQPKIRPDLPLVEAIKKRNPFTHGEVMFRKDIYEKADGYRSFFKFGQDRDLWLRMSMFCNFAIIPEFLYTRYNRADGVSGDVEKMAMQKMFAEISRQCINLRVSGEVDLVDEHGYYAPFFRIQQSKQLAEDLCKQAIISFLRGDLERAARINRMSRNERRMGRNALFHLCILISKKSRVMEHLFRNGGYRMKSVVRTRKLSALWN